MANALENLKQTEFRSKSKHNFVGAITSCQVRLINTISYTQGNGKNQTLKRRILDFSRTETFSFLLFILYFKCSVWNIIKKYENSMLNNFLERVIKNHWGESGFVSLGSSTSLAWKESPFCKTDMLYFQFSLIKEIMDRNWEPLIFRFGFF